MSSAHASHHSKKEKKEAIRKIDVVKMQLYTHNTGNILSVCVLLYFPFPFPFLSFFRFFFFFFFFLLFLLCFVFVLFFFLAFCFRTTNLCNSLLFMGNGQVVTVGRASHGGIATPLGDATGCNQNILKEHVFQRGVATPYGLSIWKVI